MKCKALIWYHNAAGTLRSSGGLMDPAFDAYGSLDAAHKALHRATPFVRSKAISVEVTICTPNANYLGGYGRDPWSYGSPKQYTVEQLVGVPA
jgi:hypothetical protein